ncbi:MAG: efflux RND transporter periplasmic adaptor subunit [Caldithrix sp.]|nr:efflux RND transporter periplasmic adaptor subunit [Caldithrix sp.]
MIYRRIIMINTFYKFAFIFLLMSAVPLIISCGSDDRDGHTNTGQAQEQQLWTCGMHPEVIKEEPGQCPKCGMDLVPVKQSTAQATGQTETEAEGHGQILYWQAPMDPNEIYDKPGKSKMGMDLIPVYESDVRGQGGTVVIDPVTVQNMNVQARTVRRTTFERTIRTVGRVAYNEESIYEVSPRITGWIETLHVDYTGATVRKGQPLLEIYSPELVTTQQEYLLALRNREAIGDTKFSTIREGAQSLVESSRQRLLNWNIPASEIDQLQKNGKVKKNLTLHAPGNGVVIEKNAVEGTHVQSGMSLFKIADLSSVWVIASVYDNEIPWIKEGQKAKVTPSYQPSDTLNGQVSYIYPYLNDESRSVQVRMVFNNADRRLKPGMYADVHVAADPIEQALVIPSASVIRSGKRNVVFVVEQGGRFQPRQVILGSENANGLMHVKAGLVEGEQIVTSAQFLIDSESRLQEAIQKMLQERRNTQ